MYVLSPCTFDFFPGHVHAENPFLYIDAYHIASVVAFKTVKSVINFNKLSFELSNLSPFFRLYKE